MSAPDSLARKPWVCNLCTVEGHGWIAALDHETTHNLAHTTQPLSLNTTPQTTSKDPPKNLGISGLKVASKGTSGYRSVTYEGECAGERP